MTEHLSETQLENYRLRRAPDAEMAAAAEHLAGCAECRGTLLRRRAGALIAGLAEVRPSHLTFEELEAYVDGRASAGERELVESHAEWCESCAGQLRMLERCAELTRSEPPRPELPGEHTRLMARAAVPMQMAAPAPVVSAFIPPPPPQPPPKRRRLWWIALAILLLAALLIWILRR